MTMNDLTAAIADRYRIERELGTGGMATVYLAEDVRHHRKVALKVLHPELSAVLGPERFLKEIELTASLQHPHILPLFDSGSAQGQLYYVMPFVEGETLRARLERERQLPIADAVRIATEVADALQYAHDRGVIHRDIKPENILLHGGHAVVADFGIALAVQQAGGQRMTQTGLSLGTPQYMSPEQAMGERTLDARSDIYALGAVTYEMLAGEPPFNGPNTQAIVARILSAQPASISETRRTVPTHVERAVLTALAKLPADRQSSAREFASAIVAAAPIDSGPMPVSGRETAGGDSRNQRPRTTRPTLIVGGALALAVAAATGYMARGSRDSASSGPVRAFGRTTQVTWEPGLEVMPAISPDGKQVAYSQGSATRMRLYVRPVAGGRSAPVTGDTTAVETHPHWSSDGSRLLFLSNGRVFSVPSGGGTARQEIPDRGGQVISAAWSSDESRIAFTIADTVFVREAGGTVRSLTRTSSPSAGCVWSSQDVLACSAGNAFYLTPGIIFNNIAPAAIIVIRASDGAVTQVSDSTSNNQMPQWSADGRWLYYLSDRDGSNDLYARRIATDGTARGALVRLTIGLNAHSFTFSSDGSRLAYSLLTESANIWSLPIDGAANATATQLTTGRQTVENVAVSRDGAWLYYDSNLAGNSDVYRVRLPSGNPERITSTPAPEFGPVPSPDGREVAFHSFGGGTRNVYVLPLDGGMQEPVVTGPLEEGLPHWSPDGSVIAFSDLQTGGSVYVASRDAEGGWSTPTLVAAGSFAAWSPDGRRLSFADQLVGGSLLTIGADGGSSDTLFDGSQPEGARAFTSAWSDDGRYVLFKVINPTGDAEVWRVPSAGGAPQRLTGLGDDRRRSDRLDFAVGYGRMYFVLKEIESDVRVIEVDPR